MVCLGISWLTLFMVPKYHLASIWSGWELSSTWVLQLCMFSQNRPLTWFVFHSVAFRLGTVSHMTISYRHYCPNFQERLHVSLQVVIWNMDIFIDWISLHWRRSVPCIKTVWHMQTSYKSKAQAHIRISEEWRIISVAPGLLRMLIPTCNVLNSGSSVLIQSDQ